MRSSLYIDDNLDYPSLLTYHENLYRRNYGNLGDLNPSLFRYRNTTHAA